MTSTDLDLVAAADAGAIDLRPLADEAQSFADAALAPRTLATYRAEWTGFLQWCLDQRLDALPAKQETVALWIAELARARKPSGIDIALAAVAHVHRHHGHPNPRKSEAVARVRRGIRRTKGTRPEQKAPALTEDVAAMVRARPDTLAGARDRALLLMGLAAAFRRSELAALAVEDVREEAEGLRVVLRRSKTDQEGEGRVVGIPHGRIEATCPVLAVRRWLAASGIQDGPLFRSVGKGGRVGGGLTGRSIARLVKRAAEDSGLDPARYSGRSLPAGLITSAARAGVAERDIARTSGHRSTAVLRSYVREASVFRDVASGRVGL